MAGWRELGNIWTTFKQLDLGPIRVEAEQATVLAFVGAEGVGKSTLITALRHDARARGKVISPTIEADLSAAASLDSADLVILVLDATRNEFLDEATRYRELAKSGRNVLVFFNKMDLLRDGTAFEIGAGPWRTEQVAYGSAIDPDSLLTSLVPRALELLPNRHLSLARHFPLFRMAVSRALINETSLANATYALGTGLAEVIPALDIPFNVADIVILTKNQALLVYKLGLALGLSSRWQDHVTKLGGVVGSGFLWRQVARQLIGLVPVWGIIPKVAVAYAGTFAVGEAVLYWYETGRKISGQGMREVYANALSQGRRIAQSLITRATRPSLARVSSDSGCPNCGRENPRDAQFCAYCATPLPK
jgi:uncharacterized protein (DUF697 family)